MKYKVEINNDEVLSSDSITECVNECLAYIKDSFKEFNKLNQAKIFRGNKLVWNSRLINPTINT